MPLTEHMQGIKILRWIVLECHLQSLILHQGSLIPASFSPGGHYG